MKKFLFLLLTFFLIHIVATLLSVMKPEDKVPDVSNAILLVGAVYLVIYFLYRFFKSFRNKQKDNEIIKMASEIFTDDETPIKRRENFLNKLPLKKLNAKFFLIAIGLGSVALLFYYYQWRPSELRKSCAEEAVGGRRITNSSVSGISKMNNSYRECLVKRGLKPESLFVK